MNNIRFRFANLSDLTRLQSFMNAHWRKGHILARGKRLWRHEFLQDNRLSVGIAEDESGQLLGIFGYIPYNKESPPDIGGSLWKITDDAQKRFPMLGLHLRNFVIESVPHRFFAAPGAGLQTMPVYRALRMNWHQMKQYFLINHETKHPKLIKHPAHTSVSYTALSSEKKAITLHRIKQPDEIERFDFKRYRDIVPFKDAHYVRHRFFNYPYFEYQVYAAEKNSVWTNLVICRRARAEGRTALRVVDFYGLETFMPDILRSLYEKARKNGDEFVDFICHGFDPCNFNKAGWQALDFEQDSIIVPNFFQPFLLKNVPVYCVSDETNLTYRQCKADGDQDRPNKIRVK